MRILICLLLSVSLASCEDNVVVKNEDITKKKSASLKIPNGDSDTVTIRQLMNEKGLKSLSVAVFENYEVIWTGTWGVKYDSIPIDVNTAYSTASISKPITALLCAILENRGLLSLSVPVNTYLKRWQLPKNKFNEEIEVTLELLLSHTSGATQGGFTDFYQGDTIPSILQSVHGKVPHNEAVKLVFKPGTDWRYSGGGYTIAMMVLEDYFGKSLADLANEYIFAPLKLEHTTMKQPNQKGFLKNVAKAHDEAGNLIRTGIPITPQVSASGMWSSPTDLATLLIEIQKALNRKGSSIISEEVAKRTTEIVTLKGMRGWSLGWERMNWYGNIDWFSHGGANTGIGGHVYATMSGGNGIVMLGNGPNKVRMPITDVLRDNIIRTHQWGTELDWVNQERLPETLISEILGHYKDIKFGPILEIKESDGKLFFPVAWGGIRHNLIYVGDSTFIMNEVSGKFRFNFVNGPTEIEFLRDDVETLSFTMFEKVR